MVHSSVHPTVLVVCRHVNDLALIGMQARDASIVVASDDPTIVKAASRDPRVQSSTFLELMRSYATVSDGVLSIRKRLNKLLRMLLTADVPPYLIEWIRWCEGGKTTQRIQDALLLVDSYQSLLRKSKARTVVLNRSFSYDFEDEVLTQTVRSMSVQLVEHKTLSYRMGRAVQAVSIEPGGARTVKLFLPFSLLVFARRLHLLLRILAAKVRTFASRASLSGSDIVFLLGSSSEKHVTNAVGVMREFARRGKFRAVALCWGARRGGAGIRQAGLAAFDLEAWFPFSMLRVLIRSYRNVLRQAERKEFRDAFRDRGFSYQGVPLGPVIVPLVQRSIKTDFLSRLFLFFSGRVLFQRVTPAAIKTWGENILDYGVVVYELFAGRDVKTKPLVFHVPVGITISNPYLSRERKPDLLFVSGPIDREIYRRDTNDVTGIVVSGFGKRASLDEFRGAVTREQSLKVLGITETRPFTLFYAPSGIVRGYVSTTEHFLVADALIDYARQHPEVAVIIKPHPTESEALWRQLVHTGTSAKNVWLISRIKSPLHCLNAADVLITKISTLALEAMELDTPVISVVLDREKRFETLFGSSVERVRRIDDLSKVLKKITRSRSAFVAWERGQLARHHAFLPQKLFRSNRRPEEIIVDEVVSMIASFNRKGRKQKRSPAR